MHHREPGIDEIFGSRSRIKQLLNLAKSGSKELSRLAAVAVAQMGEDRIASTLDRHTNDHMTSFYVNTPSGFFIEYGWGGRVIDPKTR